MKKVLAPLLGSNKQILDYYNKLTADLKSLLGYVMNLGYDDGVIVTNDYYKMRAGGISKNSFLLIKPGSLVKLIHPKEKDSKTTFQDRPPHLILVRVLEPAPTPLSNDVARTYFEMHKSHMPELDVFTKSELQWGAMKVSILGTFFDDPKNGDIGFGGDIETYLSAHMYSVHVPTGEMLEVLINAFVDSERAQTIGKLRLTESVLSDEISEVPARVSPKDFIGSRTALFGKTRLGKSNTVKIIAKMIIESKANVGQLIFDPNGEYSFSNPQDGSSSLYDMYPDQCVRYTIREWDSLNPDQKKGTQLLKVNFFDLESPADGHAIIKNLTVDRPPDYLAAFYSWEPPTKADLTRLKNEKKFPEFYRNSRARSIYFCVLFRAGYKPPEKIRIPLEMNSEIRQALAQEFPDDPQDSKKDEVPNEVPIELADKYFRKVWEWYRKDDKNPDYKWDKGDGYFDPTSISLMELLTQVRKGGSSVSGFTKIIPFRNYHEPKAGRFISEILAYLDQGKTVTVDLSIAPEELVRFFSEMLSRAVFGQQMKKFTSSELHDQYVQFYFEEAHNLFPRDDKDLSGIYNRLAKEGAKFNIGIVYSTQSIQSLSPDLLKNTENFFIAHLNDQSEINALTRFHEFRDVGPDVQRTKTRGFVRMITRSHKFALPVQINKFEPAER